ncbi:hypothetical protein BC938DRAFT_474769 [Jimgerdemannia flammicorona]|uniref:UAS domain-containing protein n=1 Tax=Jimgerdemannia flammicorona TaxID=994334 RepID=A0A433QS62_9FUNG|nr:hypothetical protein BC938DRAFT_474769 [Jimgerdemannia flammicorona]
MDVFDNLTHDQKEFLVMFQAATNIEDLDRALETLNNYDWNLVLAIQSILNSPMEFAYVPDRTSMETQEGDSEVQRSLSPETTEPLLSSALPRFFEFFPQQTILDRTPSGTTLVTPQNPAPVAAPFLLDFEKYCNSTFYQGSYLQALEVALRELTFLVVALYNDENVETEAFCRTTLQTTSFPFFAIVGPQYPTVESDGLPQMSVMDRLEGPMTVDAVVRSLANALQRCGSPLERENRQRQEHEHDGSLTEQQDPPYVMSKPNDMMVEPDLTETPNMDSTEEWSDEQEARLRQLYDQNNVVDIFWGCRIENNLSDNKPWHVYVVTRGLHHPNPEMEAMADSQKIYFIAEGTGSTDFDPSPNNIMAVPPDLQKEFDEALDDELGTSFREAHYNLVGMSTGYKRIRGMLTETPAILLYVRQKGILRRGSGGIFPTEIRGFPTDVLEASAAMPYGAFGVNSSQPSTPNVSSESSIGRDMNDSRTSGNFDPVEQGTQTNQVDIK